WRALDARPVPRSRGLRAVCVGLGRRNPQAARARPPRHGAHEAEAVSAVVRCGDGAFAVRGQRGLRRRRAGEQGRALRRGAARLRAFEQQGRARRHQRETGIHRRRCRRHEEDHRSVQEDRHLLEHLMASGKEIRTKIASVKSTQKITKAMEMVAASKLRRTQQRMAASRPYAEKIKTVIGHLSQANPDYRHPYLQTRDVKRVGYIIISTDRGLCGSVNVNTFREVVRDLRKWKEKGVETDLCLVGAKGIAFFRRLKVNVVA